MLGRNPRSLGVGHGGRATDEGSWWGGVRRSDALGHDIAPEGRDIIAQGGAKRSPGSRVPTVTEPCNGVTIRMMLNPYRVPLLLGHTTQGFALGWNVTPLRGETELLGMASMSDGWVGVSQPSRGRGSRVSSRAGLSRAERST